MPYCAFFLVACSAKEQTPVEVNTPAPTVAPTPVVEKTPEPVVEEPADPYIDDPYYDLYVEYGIELDSEDAQAMADERPLVETVREVADWYRSFQSKDQKQLEYIDFVEQFGCDASEYQYTESAGRRAFNWKIADTWGNQWYNFEQNEDGVWKCSGGQGSYPAA